MKKTTILLSLMGLILYTCNTLFASWAPPPDVVRGTSANGKFEFKRENKTGTITVYKSGERENALWKQVLPDFSGLFSTVVLADDGEMLLHVRGSTIR